MQILTDNLAPSERRVVINGFDIIESPRKAKRHIDYLPEQPPIYCEADVDEYLKFNAQVHRIGNLSKDYQQRVSIAQAIIHKPRVVVLDETSLGLDPIQVRDIRSVIKTLWQGHSVILSTHILSKLQAISDRVKIIQQSALIYHSSIDALNLSQRPSITMSLNRPPTIEQAESIRLTQSLEQPLKVTIFITPNNERGIILNQLFQRYQDQQPLIQVETFNPDLYPELLRQYDIHQDAEIVIEYQDSSEKISFPTESRVTSSIENLTLTEASSIPQNTHVLGISSLKTALFPREIDLLQRYIETGGSLLWLADTGTILSPIDRLAESLTIKFLPDIIVDPNNPLFGLDRVDFALITQYTQHLITQNVTSLSFYSQAQAMEYHGVNDAHEITGSLNIGLTLLTSVENNSAPSQRRIVVVGDADFLSNNYLGNEANLELGLNLLNWLSNNDNLISINTRAAPDTRLALSQIQQVAIGGFFLILLPLLLVGLGLRIWLKRRSC